MKSRKFFVTEQRENMADVSVKGQFSIVKHNAKVAAEKARKAAEAGEWFRARFGRVGQ